MEVYVTRLLKVEEKKIYELYSLIEPEQISKIRKFINEEDRIRTLFGYLMIRNIISEKLNIHEKHIKINKNIYGKPFLKDYPQFCFNISHSGEFVVCAVDNTPIGIDIEQVKPINYKVLAKQFFSQSEINYIINKRDESSGLEKFFSIWTLKESYIKCCGKGLTIPLNSFSIDMDESNDFKVMIDGINMGNSFKLFDMEKKYKMAICSLKKEASYNVLKLDFNYIVNKYINIK